MKIIGMILLLCVTVCAKSGYAKDHVWREGKLVDEYVEWKGYTVTEHRYAILVQEKEGRYVYVVSFEKYDYINKYAPFYVFGLSSSKKPKVTVNAPIKFAIEGDKVYIVDEVGREHKLRLEKKILK